MGASGLIDLVSAFAEAITAVDARCPAYVSRTGRQYQRGIGPYSENPAMKLVCEELNTQGFGPCGQFLPYPNAPRQKCDIWIGEPIEWAVEVKMGRFRGDNGKPDDTGIKDLISPFQSDRSALADGVKLAASGLTCRRSVLVYGFNDDERPLRDALAALDVLLRQRVEVDGPHSVAFDGLRHPVFVSGQVTAWEILDPLPS